MPSLVGPSSDSSFSLVDSFGASFVVAIFAAKDFTQMTSSLGGAFDISNLVLVCEKEMDSLPSLTNLRWRVKQS